MSKESESENRCEFITSPAHDYCDHDKYCQNVATLELDMYGVMILSCQECLLAITKEDPDLVRGWTYLDEKRSRATTMSS